MLPIKLSFNRTIFAAETNISKQKLPDTLIRIVDVFAITWLLFLSVTLYLVPTHGDLIPREDFG
jgi:hypothetical protein